jgi:hypothetical protein
LSKINLYTFYIVWSHDSEQVDLHNIKK